MEGIHPRVKKTYKDFALKFHPDRNSGNTTFAAIFARGSYLWNISQIRFLEFCKEGKYIYIDSDLFDLVPKINQRTMYTYIAKMHDMFEVMEKTLNVRLSLTKFDDNVDKMMEHLVRIYFNKYLTMFKRIRNHYSDINLRIFMYERLDETMQIKFLESWEDLYLQAKAMKRNVFYPESSVQILCSTGGRIPTNYIDLLFFKIGEGVANVIKGEREEPNYDS